MDSKRFKRKKFAPQVGSKFPELLNDKPYIGIYNGLNVSVFEKYAIHSIYNEGNFGKGSLSKSAPILEVADDVPEILMQQQWENRQKWESASDNTFEDNRIYNDSIQKLLDSTFSQHSDDLWEKWKENRMVGFGIDIVGHEAVESIPSSTTIDKTKTDPLSSMVEEILLTRKIKRERPCIKTNMKMVLVVEDNEGVISKEEKFSVSALKFKLSKSAFSVKESLKLNLVEAFFLCFAVGRIKIVNEDGITMSVADLWKEFSKVEDNFISNYIAYHHYRSHGWTVKSGIKFGGDFLLYKIGPAYFHASYLVWLLGKKRNKKMVWSEFVALNRLVETCNKDLLLCEILNARSRDEDMNSPNVLRHFSVLQVVPKRWIPSQERV